MTQLAEHDVATFQETLERVMGLRFDDSKHSLLERALGRRMAATDLDAPRYCHELGTAGFDLHELDALAADLTVGETYFFRNIEQFNALREVVLPHCVRARGAQPVQILSAACSTGEEPYTIAMVLREHASEAARASITAVDVNAASLDKAERARYSPWALRETPPEMRDRWFTPEGRNFALATEIRSAVSFRQENLVAGTTLWQPETYDVIFCRNVMMYFSTEHMRAVVGRIARSLVPGGYLFLGHAETLRGISSDFHLCHSHGTFYYRRKGGPEGTPAAVTRSRSQDAIGGTLASSVVEADSWVDAIRLASERVDRLAGPGSRIRRGTDVPTGPAPKRWDLARALVLLQEERFAEALDLVEALPVDAVDDPDVSLLLAVLLAHNGQFERAEAACRRMLEVDDLSAGAHYVMALCCEGVGDVAGAMHHDQIAMHVDPAFAMARVHVGLLARRRNDADTVRRELGHAIALLQHEDASRVLLFGGGFSREALIALCKAQLVSVGAAS
jgi:chemotaxis protein methyltransferase CheR